MGILLEKVIAYSRDLQHASTFGEVVQATKKAVLDATRYRTTWVAMIERVEDGSDWVRVLAVEGSVADFVWEKTPRFPVGDDAMLREIMQGDHPVIVEDMRTDPRTDKEMVARVGNRTTINVPIRFGDHVMGALGASSFGEEGVMPPTPDELEHLTVFAGILAAALDRVRLLEERRGLVDATQRLEAQRAELERQLRQAQKMEAVGTLAGGVAHDFNNILTAILAHAELMQLRLPSDSPLRSSLDAILASGQHAAHLTHNLLSFSRKQLVTPRALRVGPLLEHIASLVGPALRDGVRLVVEPPESELVVIADQTELEQVLINLVNNARDAMPRGGDVRVRAERYEVDDALLLRHGKGPLGACVRISVADSGVGMDAETLAHIFEPFFTTKGPKRGTGLGLATAQSIIEQHGGILAVESTPSVGSTFHVILALGEAGSAEQPPASAVSLKGTETILLAEDDPLVRELVARLLREQGYEVLLAADGEEAIEVFRANSARVRLVLTDIVMPRKTGMEVYRAVASFQQSTKVVFTSGYAAGVLEQLPADAHVLQKPLRPTTLLQTVRRLLDRRRAA